jgi:hypothetical protein
MGQSNHHSHHPTKYRFCIAKWFDEKDTVLTPLASFSGCSSFRRSEELSNTSMSKSLLAQLKANTRFGLLDSE